MNFMSMLPIVVLVAAVIIFFVRRKDNGKPKEAEATITDKTVSGDLYTFTFDLKGETKILTTREPYYAKLQKGQTGILAYRGKTLLDFEVIPRR